MPRALAGEGGGRDARGRVAGLQGAGRCLLGGPVDPLDLQGVEAPPELDDETAGTLLLAGRPVDAGEGVVDLAQVPATQPAPATMIAQPAPADRIPVTAGRPA